MTNALEKLGWRPIEEAPRDGTRIIVNDTNRKEFHFARWNDEAHRANPRPFFEREKRCSDKIYDRLYQATHYILPETIDTMAAVIKHQYAAVLSIDGLIKKYPASGVSLGIIDFIEEILEVSNKLAEGGE